jgi:sirohydrochlorin cobaltochelatase
MKKIKTLMLAMMAIMAGAAFTACGSDDDDNNNNQQQKQSNYDRYQQAVNNIVNSQKSSSKVILVVAFGSTWEQAYDTFDRVVSDYKAQFPGWDIFLSFSSAICINNARAGENVEPRDFYDPEHFLTAIGLAGYKQIVVQSLQVIPGEEYRRVRDSYVKDFMNNRNGDFTEAYMHSIDKQVVVGVPLMGEDNDVDKLAAILNNESDIKAVINAGGTVAFMGHGNPENYDYYGANIRYTELEEALQRLNPHYFVGTVDMEDNYVENVIGRMQDNGITSGKVQLYPLMSIAGDNAHNDMADEEDEESWISMMTTAGYDVATYESNFAEPCWKKYNAAEGYIPALAERSKVRALWIAHTREAIAKLGTDEALSTPTTATE